MRAAVEQVRSSGAGLFFLGAAVLMLLAGGMVFAYMRSAVETEVVLALTRDLVPGATITAQDLAARIIPKGGAPEGAVRDRGAVVGRRVRYGMVSGAVLQSGHLIEQGSDVAGQVAELGTALRAVMLPVSLVPGAERLVPGDQLELTGVFPYVAGETQTLVTAPLGRVTVLDVPRAGRGDTGGEAVLVAAEAEQASLLALTLRSGHLSVAVLGNQQQPDPAPPLRLDGVVNTWGEQAGTEPTVAAQP